MNSFPQTRSYWFFANCMLPKVKSEMLSLNVHLYAFPNKILKFKNK